MGPDVEMLVGTAWLGDRLGDPDIVVVDMRWREDGSARCERHTSQTRPRHGVV